MNTRIDTVRPGTKCLNLRSDLRNNQTINRGLAIQHDSSTICAVEYLKAQGVASDTIERVLSLSIEAQQAAATILRRAEYSAFMV